MREVLIKLDRMLVHASSLEIIKITEIFLPPINNKGNNKITEHRAIFQREIQNS